MFRQLYGTDIECKIVPPPKKKPVAKCISKKVICKIYKIYNV